MENILFLLLFICGASLVLAIACLIADGFARRAAERRLKPWLDKIDRIERKESKTDCS